MQGQRAASAAANRMNHAPGSLVYGMTKCYVFLLSLSALPTTAVARVAIANMDMSTVRGYLRFEQASSAEKTRVTMKVGQEFVAGAMSCMLA